MKPTVFYGAPTGFAGMLASPGLPKREEVALRLVSSAGEALPAEIGERFKRHFGVDIVDGIGSTEMLHIFISNRPDRGALRHDRLACAGLRDRAARRRRRRRSRTASPATFTSTGRRPRSCTGAIARRRARRSRAGGPRPATSTSATPTAPTPTPAAPTTCSRSSGVYVSPFEVEATLVQHPAVLEAAVIGVPDAEGLTKTKAFVVLRPGERGRRRGAQGLRQGPARALQISARDRVRCRTAEDSDRQDPAFQASRDGARPHMTEVLRSRAPARPTASTRSSSPEADGGGGGNSARGEGP